jgi:hypothetical protein
LVGLLAGLVMLGWLSVNRAGKGKAA